MNLGDFAWTQTKDGGVRIAYRGKVVTVLAGEKAARFLARAGDADADAQQHLMARATGNFRRANKPDGRG